MTPASGQVVQLALLRTADGGLRAALAYYRDAAESARKNHEALERRHLTVPVLGISSSHGSIPDEQPEAVAALAGFITESG